jgi:hypothetical protein
LHYSLFVRLLSAGRLLSLRNTSYFDYTNGIDSTASCFGDGYKKRLPLPLPRWEGTFRHGEMGTEDIDKFKDSLKALIAKGVHARNFANAIDYEL